MAQKLDDGPRLIIRPWTKPPLSLAVLRVTGRDDIMCCELPTGKDPVLVMNSEFELHGDQTIARFLARSRPRCMLYAEDDEDPVGRAAEIDQYLTVCENYAGASPVALKDLLVHLENRMLSRTFIVGHRLSIADIGIWILLLGIPMNFDEFINLNRWMSLVENNQYLLELRDQIIRNASQ